MIRTTCILLVSSVAVTASAHAQTQAPTAEPVTAPKTSRREPPQTMTLTLSLSGSDMDDGVSADIGALPMSGFHTDADAILAYKRKMGRATISATGRSVVRYMAPSDTVMTIYDQGQLSFSMATAHNRFQIGQIVSYSPYYEFGA